MSSAWRGIKLMMGSQYNAWIHAIAFGFVVLLGIFFEIMLFEWILIIFAAGMVFAAEAFNTAIEIDMNLTSPDYHPAARDTKDVAAGAVLIAALTASVIGFIIFIPRIILFFSGNFY